MREVSRRETGMRPVPLDPNRRSTMQPADSHEVIRVRWARENNLRDVSLDIPERRLTVFTGGSGSGKSPLVGCFPRELDIVHVDQSPSQAHATRILRRTRRSSIRCARPSQRPTASSALFSANSAAACPSYKGQGVIITELAFMSTVTTGCPPRAGSGRRSSTSASATSHPAKGSTPCQTVIEAGTLTGERLPPVLPKVSGHSVASFGWSTHQNLLVSDYSSSEPR